MEERPPKKTPGGDSWWKRFLGWLRSPESRQDHRNRGYLAKNQLDRAREVARQTGRPDVSRVLVELSMVGEREILQSKAQQMGFAFVDLDRVQPDAEALNSMPRALARSLRAIPIKRDGDNLWIATDDPGAIDVGSLREVTSCRIIPVMATAAAIDFALAKGL